MFIIYTHIHTPYIHISLCFVYYNPDLCFHPTHVISKYLFAFIHMYENLFAYEFVNYMYAWCPRKPEERFRFLLLNWSYTRLLIIISSNRNQTCGLYKKKAICLKCSAISPATQPFMLFLYVWYNKNMYSASFLKWDMIENFNKARFILTL